MHSEKKFRNNVLVLLSVTEIKLRERCRYISVLLNHILWDSFVFDLVWLVLKVTFYVAVFMENKYSFKLYRTFGWVGTRCTYCKLPY